MKKWYPSKELPKNINIPLLVEMRSGEKYYAIYSNIDEFDVHGPNGNEYRAQWYKFSSKSIKRWKYINRI